MHHIATKNMHYITTAAILFTDYMPLVTAAFFTMEEQREIAVIICNRDTLKVLKKGVVVARRQGI